MRYLLLISLLSIYLLPSATRAVTIFDNGQINDFSGVDPTGAIVRDSSQGDPTTLNVRSGADLGPTDVEDASILRVFAGSSLFDLDALDTARIVFSGGSHGGVDLQDDSRGAIFGGRFVDCSPCLRLFSTAEGVVTAGSFVAFPGQIAVLASGFSSLRILGGTYEGTVRVEDDATLEIFGGAIGGRVVALNQSTLVLYGEDFLAAEGSTTVLDGFGEITETFDGTITGTLSDGSALAVDGLNGTVGSKIVLAPAPASVPGFATGPAVVALVLGLLAVGSRALLTQRSSSLRGRLRACGSRLESVPAGSPSLPTPE